MVPFIFLIRRSNMAAKQEVPSITTYSYPNRLITSTLQVLIRDEFNGAIHFLFRRSNMAAKQEVALITSYINASCLIFSLCRFEWVTSSMAPFIL